MPSAVAELTDGLAAVAPALASFPAVAAHAPELGTAVVAVELAADLG